MKLMRINSSLSISDQLTEQDVEKLVAEGVEVLVCNRPDGESDDQTPFSLIQQAAGRVGLQAIAIPFKSGEMQAEHITAFAPILNSQQRVHAYCRTGNRSFNLYAATYAKAGGSKSDIKQQAKQVGFDVSAIIGP